MNVIFVYAVVSSMVLTILWATWRVTMRRQSCVSFNRGLLIAVYVASLILWPVSNLMSSPTNVSATGITVDTTILSGVGRETSSRLTDFLWIVEILYAVGIIITFIYLLYGVASILLVRKRSSEVVLPSGESVRIIPGEGVASFSFMGEIYISERCFNSREREMMLLHEGIHGNRFHSVDLLVANMVCLLQWFNPVAWLMLSDLKDIHEFEVDSVMLCKGVSKYDYQKTLLSCMLINKKSTITNNFNQRSLKIRLIMMSERNKPQRRLRALALGPALLVAVAITSSPAFKTFASDATAVKVFNTTTESSADDKVVEKIYEAPDVIASFPGGEMEMFKFLMNNMRYPKEAEKANEQGRVIVSFIVASNGEIKDVHVKNGVSKLLDEEAVRVVESFPRWKPAQVKGKNVASSFSLPISFKLQTDKKK